MSPASKGNRHKRNQAKPFLAKHLWEDLYIMDFALYTNKYSYTLAERICSLNNEPPIADACEQFRRRKLFMKRTLTRRGVLANAGVALLGVLFRGRFLYGDVRPNAAKGHVGMELTVTAVTAHTLGRTPRKATPAFAGTLFVSRSLS